jgi:hypothetical protein
VLGHDLEDHDLVMGRAGGVCPEALGRRPGEAVSPPKRPMSSARIRSYAAG